MLLEGLKRLSREYVFARGKSFSGSELGDFVRKDLTVEAKKRLTFLPFDLTVKGSVGAGNWAAVPWLAFFDPLITSSATKGFYVVYLVNPIEEEFYLSLNQGTTAVFNEFGTVQGERVLQRRAADIIERVPEFAKEFDTSPINLGSSDRLPRGYTAGHAFGRKYEPGAVSGPQFEADLEKMLFAYEALINRGGTTPADVMQEEAGTENITEIRKYVLSKRIERGSNVRARVLQSRKPICEGCNLDPAKHYSYEGPLKNTPLDVHHAVRISELAEGESRRYKIPDDFLVLCPTCHRMIHKQQDVSNVGELRERVRFAFADRLPDLL